MHRLEQAHNLMMDRPDEALRLCNEVLNENASSPTALFLVGHIFLKAEKYGLAYTIYKRVVELMPDKPEGWNNLGRCLQQAHQHKEALEYFFKSLELDSNNEAALNNIGLIYVNIGQPEKTIEYAARALKVKPHMSDAIENRSLAHLMLKNWEQGWEDYRAFLGGQFRKEKHYGGKNQWLGAKGRTIVVYGEQGLGDEIMFASCINELTKDCDVIIDCEPRLETLFQRSFPQTKVYGTNKLNEVEWPLKYEIDSVSAIGSLPEFYRNKDSAFTGEAYLIADPVKKVQARAALDYYGNKPKIGIAWNGGSTNTGSFDRSISLKDLRPILDQDATFISLEYKKPDLEGSGIIEMDNFLYTQNYDDTAALVDELDLVISVTTTVVHLAGALGKECWCMVPEYPNWRFHLKGETPWHKSVKLFRKTETEDWNRVINEISENLHEYLKNFHRNRPATASGVHSIATLNHAQIEHSGDDHAIIIEPTTNRKARANSVHL